jgi:hypothetical protein
MMPMSRSPVAVLGGALALVLALAAFFVGGGSGAVAASGPAGSPFGTFDGVRAVPGGFELWGWAIDPDTTAPIYVWVTVDGAGRHVYSDADRPDVAVAHPGYGPEHGFRDGMTATSGTHRVCVTASNVGPGAHTSLGCRTVTVRAGSPFGNVESVRAGTGEIRLAGWAIDPDTTAPIYVWVTVDGVGRHLYANGSRPDVGAAYPGYGPDHGFSGTVTASGGTHTVCVTGSNVGSGAHRSLGCRAVTVVPVGSPFGNVESVRGVLGGIEVTGWAVDPDTTGPIYVWVTLDGVGRHLYANASRPDVAAAYPGSGPEHGFTALLTAPAGSHTVCVTASNVGPGAHRSLGCWTGTAQGDAVLSGAVCYPSEYIPAMNAFFRDTTTGQTWTLPIALDQSTYQVGLPAGTYLAFAYRADLPTFGGAYTAFVPCGSTAACTDHTLLPVTVQHGQTAGGVDLCDWYGGPGPWLPPNPLG